MRYADIIAQLARQKIEQAKQQSNPSQTQSIRHHTNYQQYGNTPPNDRLLHHLTPYDFYTRYHPHNIKRDGNRLTTLCVFHEDRQPSLSINTTTGQYYCFACGAKGNMITYYQKRHGSVRDLFSDLGLEG